MLIFCLGLTATVALAQTNTVEIPNPLGEQDIWGVVTRAINFLFLVCMYGGLVMIIWAGWSYITSQGDPGKAKKAMGMITSVLIGLAIVLLAKGIISFTYYIVTGNKGGVPGLNNGGSTNTNGNTDANTPYVPESTETPNLNPNLFSN